MTTPANRAPMFVVVYPNGVISDAFSTEGAARSHAIRHDGTVHPIGAALPVAVKEKTLGQVASDAYSHSGPFDGRWGRVASAVIAAYEAGKEWERVVRFAVRETRLDRWAKRGSNVVVTKPERTVFDTRLEANTERHEFDNWRKRTAIVRITTRRRVKR